MLMLSQYFAEHSKLNHFKSLFRALKMKRYCNKNISTNFSLFRPIQHNQFEGWKMLDFLAFETINNFLKNCTFYGFFKSTVLYSLFNNSFWNAPRVLHILQIFSLTFYCPGEWMSNFLRSIVVPSTCSQNGKIAQ